MSLLSRSAIPFARQLCRQMAKECPKIKGSKKVEIKVNPAFYKLKEKQKKFGIDDGVPVWLKNGATDKLLYQVSWAGVLIGLGLSLHVFYTLIMFNHGGERP